MWQRLHELKTELYGILVVCHLDGDFEWHKISSSKDHVVSEKLVTRCGIIFRRGLRWLYEARF